MKITKSTIQRTICFALVAVNMILEKCGLDVLQFDDNQIMSFTETLIEMTVLVVGFWKNNSFTQKAIKADKFLQELKESE